MRHYPVDKANETANTVQRLIDINFISKSRYTKRLYNIVLVKKYLRKWIESVNYTYFNWACLKYSYPLSNIDKLVDNSAGYKLMSFMDTYCGDNQSPMYEPNRGKKTFMTERANYQYNVMPVGLKNVEAIY